MEGKGASHTLHTKLLQKVCCLGDSSVQGASCGEETGGVGVRAGVCETTSAGCSMSSHFSLIVIESGGSGGKGCTISEIKGGGGVGAGEELGLGTGTEATRTGRSGECRGEEGSGACCCSSCLIMVVGNGRCSKGSCGMGRGDGPKARTGSTGHSNGSWGADTGHTKSVETFRGLLVGSAELGEGSVVKDNVSAICCKGFTAVRCVGSTGHAEGS